VGHRSSVVGNWALGIGHWALGRLRRGGKVESSVSLWTLGAGGIVGAVGIRNGEWEEIALLASLALLAFLAFDSTRTYPR
jgi:hypothetical protein